MNATRTPDYLRGLLKELLALPKETEWVEYKHNNDNPQEIGEYISALSNSAALCGKAFAYLVWGVADDSRAVVGTVFKPKLCKKGNEELENWLLRLLAPRIDFSFFEFASEDGCDVVVLEISRAAKHPVQFQGHEFIRIGSYKKHLKDFPEKERSLWRIFDHVPFEELIAVERVTADEVLRLLDCPAYFDLLELSLPATRDGILFALRDDDLIHPCKAGNWSITNLGAILFAKRLSDFGALKRKAVRVVLYNGPGRTEAVRELAAATGYACGFETLIGSINGLLPSREVIGKALRKSVPMLPELAVRELVANMLIHQDFSATGTGPMVEVFCDRLEVTNPGEPLMDTQRFVDTPPKSRNESLASLMRRFRICEERGSGIDKVVAHVEQFRLPAPTFEAPEGFTRASLFAYRSLAEMDKADRTRACYLHACLRYVTRKSTTNASVRKRFGIAEKNAATASRILNDAVDAGLVAVEDINAGTRIRRYLPFWAGSDGRTATVV